MKIIMPVDEKMMETNVCISFGRAPFFLIYNLETKESLFIENTAAESIGGAGISAAQTIVDNKADVLLTPRCGEKAAQVLNAAQIKLYKTTYVSAMENIEAYKAGQLSLLNEIHAGFHGHGGN
jgi:predicted outer membrane repeat protein